MSLYQFWTLQSPKVVKYGMSHIILENSSNSKNDLMLKDFDNLFEENEEHVYNKDEHIQTKKTQN